MTKLTFRGTPIYVDRDRDRIALVPEIRHARKRLGRWHSCYALTALEPAALYVIDGSGVKRLALERPTARLLGLVALSFLVAPALNWLSHRGRKHG